MCGTLAERGRKATHTRARSGGLQIISDRPMLAPRCLPQLLLMLLLLLMLTDHWPVPVVGAVRQDSSGRTDLAAHTTTTQTATTTTNEAPGDDGRKLTQQSTQTQMQTQTLGTPGSSDKAARRTRVPANESGSPTAPAVVLATGGIIIVVMAIAFRRRHASKRELDPSDPMQQSLLFHDMDYAAM